MPAKDLAHYMSLKYPVEIVEGAEGGYFATHPDLDGCMAEGGTAAAAIANLADSRELWIATRLDHHFYVPEPKTHEPSGHISLRMTPSLHASLASLADRQRVSLNLLIVSVLARYAGGEDALQDAVAAACSAMAGSTSHRQRSSPGEERARELPAAPGAGLGRRRQARRPPRTAALAPGK
ncbi:MAG TPA: type II toxin-antitoxin system HicB family antitoxin [Thermoanaerobaculia bacterium]|jgi:antitoxin HicB|nr:type II toxin-antitoxin system HicB family antitoxin [Thermoanaerobaculia bacterium]